MARRGWVWVLAAGLLVGGTGTARAQLEEDPAAGGQQEAKPKKKIKKVVEEDEGDEEEAKPKPKPKKVEAEPAAAADGTEPKVSIAMERLGGFAYVNASASDADASVGITVLNVGGIAINPYGAPRLGVDFAVGGGGFWVGGALGFSTTSASAKSGSQSSDIGSVTIYSLTPRVGYRVPLSPNWDLTPRLGLTLAGGSVSQGDGGNDKFGVFSLAISAEGAIAYRVTSSFNLLGGLALDRTLSASVSQSTTSNGQTSSSSSDIKGGLTNIQLWLGIGGYL